MSYLPFLQKSQQTAASSEGVFSTAVDEKVLAEAKSRHAQAQGSSSMSGAQGTSDVPSGLVSKQSIFQTEQWDSEKPPQPSMSDILEETADKQYVTQRKRLTLYSFNTIDL